jgi:predicted O-linked N-acetylglucosamine transferase (SPINDLY family)
MQNYGPSIECLSRAVAINNKNEKALYNLGLSFIAAGRVIEADRMLRAARDVAPANEAIHSALLFNLNNLPTLTRREVFDEHRRWGSRFDGLSAPGNAERRSARGHRKLRVAYLSPDFKRHSVFYFIAPILRAHDRSTIEFFGYADVLQPDEATLQLQAAADHWRDVSCLNNPQLLQLIRDDAIDILVDLAGHTANNRLPIFAARAAPVQISWIGYPGSTGLRQMDYRFTDERADPVGEADALHTETLVRLETGFLCYEPSADSPSPGPTPALANAYVTFGSFNNLSKVTDAVIAVWADILQRVPSAKMIIKAKGLGDAANRNRILTVFQSCGIDASRIECLGFIASVDHHLDQYKRIDIALDTFPYNGTTTTCEALWMGVPVISLVGDRHVSRVGNSLLTTVGLGELIADTQAAYVECAIALAADIARLKNLRARIRDQVRASPLMDASGFARMLERHYVSFMDRRASV